METRGIPPAPRWTHTAVEYQGGMYVFGGFYGFGGQGPTVRGTSQIRASYSAPATAHTRDAVCKKHSVVHYSSSLYLPGRDRAHSLVTLQGRYNDLHRLDLERMTWTKVSLRGNFCLSPAAAWARLWSSRENSRSSCAVPCEHQLLLVPSAALRPTRR